MSTERERWDRMDRERREYVARMSKAENDAHVSIHEALSEHFAQDSFSVDHSIADGPEDDETIAVTVTVNFTVRVRK